ncbi:hypothetical protein Golax_003073, partial [Gossypium laxum]|nr:hypothetical protein [Gossypium laxum]
GHRFECTEEHYPPIYELGRSYGNRSSGDEVGLVAQRIRARGYKPWCQGFESILAHNRPKREEPFPL